MYDLMWPQCVYIPRNRVLGSNGDDKCRYIYMYMKRSLQDYLFEKRKEEEKLKYYMGRKKENQEKKSVIIINRGGRLKKKEMHMSIDKLDRFS